MACSQTNEQTADRNFPLRQTPVFASPLRAHETESQMKRSELWELKEEMRQRKLNQKRDQIRLEE